MNGGNYTRRHRVLTTFTYRRTSFRMNMTFLNENCQSLSCVCVCVEITACIEKGAYLQIVQLIYSVKGYAN